MIQKRLFFGLISLFIIITSACQKDDTPSCSYPKNAKLKRIVSCGYIESECPTRECDDIVSIYKEYEYDSQSRIKKVMWHARNEKHLYLYNQKDQLEKIEYYNSFEDDYLLYKTVTYTYSDDGKKNQRKHRI